MIEKSMSDFARAISSHTRRQILEMIFERSECELACGEILRRLGVPKANLSQHLNVLDKAGMIRRIMEGTFLTVALTDTGKSAAYLCDEMRKAVKGKR